MTINLNATFQFQTQDGQNLSVEILNLAQARFIIRNAQEEIITPDQATLIDMIGAAQVLGLFSNNGAQVISGVEGFRTTLEDPIADLQNLHNVAASRINDLQSLDSEEVADFAIDTVTSLAFLGLAIALGPATLPIVAGAVFTQGINYFLEASEDKQLEAIWRGVEAATSAALGQPSQFGSANPFPDLNFVPDLDDLLARVENGEALISQDFAEIEVSLATSLAMTQFLELFGRGVAVLDDEVSNDIDLSALASIVGLLTRSQFGTYYGFARNLYDIVEFTTNANALISLLAEQRSQLETIVATAEENAVFGDGNRANREELTDDFILLGTNSAETLFGSEGDDSIDGGLGGDIVYGAAGNDIIRLEGTGHTVYGGVGDDAVTIDFDGTQNATFAHVDGGAGHDRIFINGDAANFTIEADRVFQNNGPLGLHVTFENVEDIVFGRSNYLRVDDLSIVYTNFIDTYEGEDVVLGNFAYHNQRAFIEHNSDLREFTRFEERIDIDMRVGTISANLSARPNHDDNGRGASVPVYYREDVAFVRDDPENLDPFEVTLSYSYTIAISSDAVSYFSDDQYDLRLTAPQLSQAYTNNSDMLVSREATHFAGAWLDLLPGQVVSGTGTVVYSFQQGFGTPPAFHVFSPQFRGVLERGAFEVDISFSMSASPGIELFTLSGQPGTSVYTPAQGFDALGDSADNTLTGSEQNDLLDTRDGADFAYGGSGNDRLLGGGGNDTLYGGDGTDTLNGGDGDDFIFGGDSSADLRDLVFAGTGNDSVDGGYGNDEIYGQDGNDTIAGGFGADTLNGQNGNDVLTGSALSDLVSGNAGDDFVNGGFGHDRINGGSGADRFFHLGILDHGSDFIQDYNAAEGDVLLSGIAGATRADFQVNIGDAIAVADGEKAGDDAVQEAFVIYRPTEQILWALIDGDGQSSINIRIGAETFDLLA